MLPFLYERKKKEEKKEQFEYRYIEDCVPEQMTEKKKDSDDKEERGVVIIQL